LWAAARAKLGVTARAQLGLSPGLIAYATLFDLPKLGSLPVTLHSAGFVVTDLLRAAEQAETAVLDQHVNGGKRKAIRQMVLAKVAPMVLVLSFALQFFAAWLEILN